jgi:hypothetical protein
MNESDWADRFSQEVDMLLSQAGRTDDEPAPAAYCQALDLAQVLTTTDFSDESQRKAVLRRRLLNRVGGQEPSPRWRPILAISALVIVALGLVAATRPDLLAHLVQSLRPGPHTTVYQADPASATALASRPLPSTPEVVQRDDGWTIRTSIGNFGGNTPPEMTLTVVRVDGFDQAQEVVSFDLRQPAYLPAGYQLREAMVAPGESSFLFYDGPRGEIVLVQTPVYVRVEAYQDGEAVSTSVMVGVLTDKPVQEVVRSDWQAGWYEGNSLVWEAGGISYTLGGVNMGLEEAIRIAESLG